MLSLSTPNFLTCDRARIRPNLSHLAEVVPADLLLEIATAVESRSDILSLSLTCTRIFSAVSSVLYKSVVLTSAEQCVVTLGMLSSCPALARHVRELVIRLRPNMNMRQGFHEAEIASAAVRDIALSKKLDALTTFGWDDDELPYHDDMWFALRVCCPQLRYLSATMGSLIPFPTAHFFDFTDLRGFSIFLRSGFYDNHVDIFMDDSHPVPQKFWDMLINRCPDLEELTIDGISSIPMAAHRLVDGRWPKLKRLILGDVVIDWTAWPLPNDEKRPFVTFLETHSSSLRSLTLSRSNIDPNHLVSLDPHSLHLSSFTGTLQQLRSIPHTHQYLKSVTFREAMQTREVTALAVAGLLQRLTNMTKLKISFMLNSMYDSGNLLRSLVASCPNLRHLELTCGHKPSFQLDSFSKTIRGFPKLRVLHLTIVRYPGDETISSGAMRIALANPRLQKFSLTFLPHTHPLALPFPLPFLPIPLRTKDTGVFTLTCDKHGLPLSLRAIERRRLVWPLGLGQSCKTTRYVSDLRPIGTPGKRQEGFKGILALLAENSAAGEEIRMIVFCTFLLTLAIWGFVASSRNRA